MIQKLMALVAGDCAGDNPDSAMNHEVLLPGHLFQMFIRVYFTISFFFFLCVCVGGGGI